MQIFVEKSKLENELRIFQGIFEKNAIIEILKNIKITAVSGGALELVATDLEIGLISNFIVDVVDPGTFTVNGKDLYELISKMPEGVVEISEENDLQIVITNDKKTCKYKLLGMQSIDYPNLPESDFSQSYSIPFQKMLEMINNSYYVISPELKFNLGGALFCINGEQIEIAATDGHRLSFSSFHHNYSIDRPLEYIISRKTLIELTKIGSDGDLIFSFDANNLFFKHNSRVLSSRIIDQKFPNYKAVIPEKSNYFAYINTHFLLQTLRRILIFKTRNNGVIFSFSKGKLILERNTPEKGEGHDEISIDYEGKLIEIGFNGNFILDFLTHIHSDQICVEMNNGGNAFIFKPVVKSDLDFIYIVMPLNI